MQEEWEKSTRKITRGSLKVETMTKREQRKPKWKVFFQSDIFSKDMHDISHLQISSVSLSLDVHLNALRENLEGIPKRSGHVYSDILCIHTYTFSCIPVEHSRGQSLECGVGEMHSIHVTCILVIMYNHYCTLYMLYHVTAYGLLLVFHLTLCCMEYGTVWL